MDRDAGAQGSREDRQAARSPVKLVFTPEAQEQADECDAWWREHRDERDLFARELAGATELVSGVA